MIYPLTIFYDGACPLCKREMRWYQSNNPHGRLTFVDISQVDFVAEAYGRSNQDFMARMHVRDADGVYTTGVDAFILIWQAYPEKSKFQRVRKIIGVPGIKHLARLFYALFARYRHLLVREKNCAAGVCRPPVVDKNIRDKDQ